MSDSSLPQNTPIVQPEPRTNPQHFIPVHRVQTVYGHEKANQYLSKGWVLLHIAIGQWHSDGEAGFHVVFILGDPKLGDKRNG